VRRGRGIRVLAVAAGLTLAAAATAADVTDPKVKLTKADQAHATASVLVGSALGAAWSGSLEKPVAIKIPICPAYTPNNSDLTITGHAEGLSTLANEGLQIDTDVEIFKTTGQVDTLFKRMLQPKLATCLKYDLLKSVGRNGVIIGKVTRLTVPKAGTHAALFRVSLSVKNGSKAVGVDSDFLYVSQQRTVFFVNIVLPESLESQLTPFEQKLAPTLAKRARV